MIIFDGLAVGQCCLAILLSSLTFHYIHEASAISQTFKSRQRKLLVALCLQVCNEFLFRFRTNVFVGWNYTKCERSIPTFKSLFQTGVPVICVYIPYLGLISSPIVALNLGVFPDLCPILIASFPAWDALVIIIVIKDYRRGCSTLFSSWNNILISGLLSACRSSKIREGNTRDSVNPTDK